MSNISQIIESLYVKVEKLIYSHQNLQEKNILLSTQKEELLSKVEEQKNKIEELTQTNTQLKLIKSLKESESNTSDVKLKINEMVREVDTCIAILNR